MGELEIREEGERHIHPAVTSEMSVAELVDQVKLIQEASAAVMKEGEHYGVIPGTDKPTLYKPGAEKLLLLFRLGPRYTVEKTWDGNHLTVEAACELQHITTGNFVGQGIAMCTTKETRYAYRQAKPSCPNCKNEHIIKGKAEYGGGWICFKKIGGCGAKYDDGDSRIESQPTGRVDNPDLADTYNTVTKMACKRALVAAVLNATAASDLFTQDLEDLPETKPREPAHELSDEKRMELVSALARLSWSDLWSAESVLANASRRYGRPIERLADLSDDEAEQIIAGANKWREENQPEEGEVVDAEGSVEEPENGADL